MADEQDGSQQQDKQAKATSQAVKNLGKTADDASKAMSEFVANLKKLADQSEKSSDSIAEAGKKSAEALKKDVQRFQGKGEIENRLLRGSISELTKALSGQSNGLSPFRNFAAAAIEISTKAAAETLAKNSVQSGTTLALMSRKILSFGGVLGVAANAVISLGEAAYNGGIMLMENYQQMVESGQSFGGSMLTMANTAWQAGMSISQLSDVVSRFSPVMATVGVRQFAQFSKSVRDASFDMGQYGLSIEGMNRFLGEYVENLRLQGREFDLTSDKQQNYARQTLDTIFKAQQASGKQREEILRDAAAAQRIVTYRTRMRLDKGISEDQQAGINRLVTFFAGQPGEAGAALSRGFAQLFGQGNQVQFAEFTRDLLQRGLGDVAEDMRRTAEEAQANPEDSTRIGNEFARRIQNEYFKKYAETLRIQALAGDAGAERILEMLADVRALTDEQMRRAMETDQLTRLFTNIRNAISDLSGKISSAFLGSGAFKAITERLAALANVLQRPETIQKISNFMGWIADKFVGVLEWLVEKLESFIDTVSKADFWGAITGVWQDITKNYLHPTIEKFWTIGSEALETMLRSIIPDWLLKKKETQGPLQKQPTAEEFRNNPEDRARVPVQGLMQEPWRGTKQKAEQKPDAAPSDPAKPKPDDPKPAPTETAKPTPSNPTRNSPVTPAKPAPVPVGPKTSVPIVPNAIEPSAPLEEDPAKNTYEFGTQSSAEPAVPVPIQPAGGVPWTSFVSPGIDLYKYRQDPEKYVKDKMLQAERTNRTMNDVDRWLYNMMPRMVQGMLTPPKEDIPVSVYEMEARIREMEKAIVTTQGALRAAEMTIANNPNPNSQYAQNQRAERDKLVEQNDVLVAMIRILNESKQILKNIESQNNKGI